MYKIEVIPSAKKDLARIAKRFFIPLKDKILTLASDPRPHNCVKLTADEGYRIRSGDYRIIYRIDDKNKIVYVYRVKHRKEAYR